MIGEHGWAVEFTVHGADQADMRAAILRELYRFWPAEEADDGWRMDVAVTPAVHNAEGDVVSWEGRVTAQRVKVRSATDHGPALDEFTSMDSAPDAPEPAYSADCEAQRHSVCSRPDRCACRCHRIGAPT